MPMPIISGAWTPTTSDRQEPQRIFYTFRDKVTEGNIILSHDTGEIPARIPVPLWASIPAGSRLHVCDGG